MNAELGLWEDKQDWQLLVKLAKRHKRETWINKIREMKRETLQ